MELGIIGLGKMGANMARRLTRNDHEVEGYDLSEEAVQALTDEGIDATTDLEAFLGDLEAPRRVWIMVPAGDPVDKTLDAVLPHLEEGDIVIDGGNSKYTDTLRRAERVQGKGLHYVDAGVSGGVWGLDGGYSMMVGGSDEAIEALRPVFETLAPGPDKGWGHVGKAGSGHFVKMVHNGIEYGIMQAYAEGFDILENKDEFDLDLHQVAEIWRFGSVIRSWLLDLVALALEEDADLGNVAPYVPDSGEGRWTVKEAIDLDVPAPVITSALLERLQSREDDSFTYRLLSAMRGQFGGHAVKKAEKMASAVDTTQE